MSTGFADLAAARLYRETDLDRIGVLLNWGPLNYRLEKFCRKEGGRPPFPPLVMFRALLSGAVVWAHGSPAGRGLVRPAVVPPFCRARNGGGHARPYDPVPLPRPAGARSGLTGKLLALVNAQLEAKGLMLKQGHSDRCHGGGDGGSAPGSGRTSAGSPRSRRGLSQARWAAGLRLWLQSACCRRPGVAADPRGQADAGQCHGDRSGRRAHSRRPLMLA